MSFFFCPLEAFQKSAEPLSTLQRVHSGTRERTDADSHERQKPVSVALDGPMQRGHCMLAANRVCTMHLGPSLDTSLYLLLALFGSFYNLRASGEHISGRSWATVRGNAAFAEEQRSKGKFVTETASRALKRRLFSRDGGTLEMEAVGGSASRASEMRGALRRGGPPGMDALTRRTSRDMALRMCLRGGGQSDMEDSDGDGDDDDEKQAVDKEPASKRRKQEASFTLGGGESSSGSDEVDKRPAAVQLAKQEVKAKRDKISLQKFTESWAASLAESRTDDHGQGGGIFLIGGRRYDASMFGVKSAFFWNSTTNHWDDMPRMTWERINCAAVQLGRKLYVAGGWHTTCKCALSVVY